MRILVLSDSHGNAPGILKAIELQPSAEVILYLGDGERDTLAIARQYPDKKLIQVSGNCDFAPSHSLEKTVVLNGCKIFLCHGHTCHVKSGLDELAHRASAAGCNVALFGHTHQPLVNYRDGLYLMNPGSIGCGCPRTYGIIDITEQGVFCNTIALH